MFEASEEELRIEIKRVEVRAESELSLSSATASTRPYKSSLSRNDLPSPSTSRPTRPPAEGTGCLTFPQNIYRWDAFAWFNLFLPIKVSDTTETFCDRGWTTLRHEWTFLSHNHTGSFSNNRPPQCSLRKPFATNPIDRSRKPRPSFPYRLTQASRFSIPQS